MAKILGSWSGMRKYLEQEMLAHSLRGRVRYGCTSYIGMDGCHIFEICIDGKQVKRFSWETVNTFFIEHRTIRDHSPLGTEGYWAEFWSLLQEYPMKTRTEYTDEEFCHALRSYREQRIQESIDSDDPLVRMFALLDRRVGKRTLTRLEQEMSSQPQWLQKIYSIRVNAENL
ncbi:MAG: hypothetical protein IJW45_02320 [Oscillospiraceae bacterium]|nr:hypothetical protein [Oscillospiraceae bacterium]